MEAFGEADGAVHAKVQRGIIVAGAKVTQGRQIIGTYTRGVPSSGSPVAEPERPTAAESDPRTKSVTSQSVVCRRALEASVRTSPRRVTENSGASTKAKKSSGDGDGDPSER